MTETVTSKYEIGYWVKLIVFTIIIITGISITIYIALKEYDTEHAEDLIEIFLLLVVLIGLYLFQFSRSIPRKIIVSSESIVIDQHIITKQIIINYKDINKTRTIRPNFDSSGVFSQISNYQILEIELYNKKKYRIDEADFENYSELKQAIYDHVFRHQ